MENINRMDQIRMKQDLRINLPTYISRRQSYSRLDEVKQFSKRLFESSKDFYQKDLWAHFGCVNAIEFSNDGNLLFSGGDDRRVLMWDVNSALMYYSGRAGDNVQPKAMRACHYSNIFCLVVDDSNKRVLSGGNDDQVIVHNFETGNPVDYFLHDSPVFALSLDPNNENVFASASDRGLISIYDIRQSNSEPMCLAKFRSPFHGVMYNPAEPQLVATANSQLGVHIWDVRKPKEVVLECSEEQSMAVRWNQSGNLLLSLRNLRAPLLTDVTTPNKSLEFDADCYFNACTMKSCSFAGDNDQFILSGSDDFNLYMWKIPDPWPEVGWIKESHLVLTGHRSIVNQVRYSPCKHVIATSGVEKIIKIWSPYNLPYSTGDRDTPSPNISRRLCQLSSCARGPGFLTHDYSQGSMTEDKEMIHFFDCLLRNELDTSISSPFDDSDTREDKLASLIKRKKRLSRKMLSKSEGCTLLGDEDATYKGKRYHYLFSMSEDEEAVTPELSVADSVSFCGNSRSSSTDNGVSCGCSGTSSSSSSSSTSCSSSSSSSSSNGNSSLSSSSSSSSSSHPSSSSNKKLESTSFNFKDSGINVSETRSSDDSSDHLVFKKKKINSKRNYRKKRIHVSDSDSDKTDTAAPCCSKGKRFRNSKSKNGKVVKMTTRSRKK